MSIVNIPAAVAASVGGQTYGQLRFDTDDVSDATGAAFTVAYGPPRWTMSLASKQAMALLTAGAWEAVLLKLRGRVNVLAVYDFLRPQPVGTLRGNPYLGAAAAIGATTLVINNAIGSVEAGDWFSAGTGFGTSQLIKAVERVDSAVLASAVFSWTLSASPFTWTLSAAPFAWGVAGAQITLTFEPPLRQAFAAFEPLVWSAPLGYYKLANTSSTWQARANGPAIDGITLDLVEQWA